MEQVAVLQCEIAGEQQASRVARERAEMVTLAQGALRHEAEERRTEKRLLEHEKHRFEHSIAELEAQLPCTACVKISEKGGEMCWRHRPPLAAATASQPPSVATGPVKRTYSRTSGG